MWLLCNYVIKALLGVFSLRDFPALQLLKREM